MGSSRLIWVWDFLLYVSTCNRSSSLFVSAWTMVGLRSHRQAHYVPWREPQNPRHNRCLLLQQQSASDFVDDTIRTAAATAATTTRITNSTIEETESSTVRLNQQGGHGSFQSSTRSFFNQSQHIDKSHSLGSVPHLNATTSPDNRNQKNETDEFSLIQRKAASLTFSDPAFGLGIGQLIHDDVDMAREKKQGKPNEAASHQPFPPLSSLLAVSTKFFSTRPLQDIKLPMNTTSTRASIPPAVAGNTTKNLLGISNVSFPDISNSSSSSNSRSTSYNSNNNYDPLSLFFWNEETTNFTRQQMEAAQRAFWEYSVNASRQLDEAQKKALLETYKVLGMIPPLLSSSSSSTDTNNNNNKLLSMEELDAYLRLNGYVKHDDLQAGAVVPQSNNNNNAMSMGLPISQFGRGRGRALQGKDTSGFHAIGSSGSGPVVNANTADSISGSPVFTSTTSMKKDRATRAGRVAFPQPSIMSYSNLKWGSTAAAALLGLVGGITILPNLWLLGAILGGLYGYETTKNLAERPLSKSTNALNSLIVYLGREITKVYLKIFDFGSGIWFMYKTGQLSYEVRAVL